MGLLLKGLFLPGVFFRDPVGHGCVSHRSKPSLFIAFRKIDNRRSYNILLKFPQNIIHSRAATGPNAILLRLTTVSAAVFAP